MSNKQIVHIVIALMVLVWAASVLLVGCDQTNAEAQQTPMFEVIHRTYSSSVYRASTPDGWLVVATSSDGGPHMIEIQDPEHRWVP